MPGGGGHAASARSAASSSSGGGGGARGAVFRGGGVGAVRRGGGEAVDIGSLDDRGRDGQDDIMDFQTIDWTFYNEKDRERRMEVNYGSRRGAISRALLSVYDAMQGWLALSAIGFLSGALAAMISCGCDWMTDIKFGMCWGRGFWITRTMCCKDSADMLSCPNWQTWAQIMGFR